MARSLNHVSLHCKKLEISYQGDTTTNIPQWAACGQASPPIYSVEQYGIAIHTSTPATQFDNIHLLHPASSKVLRRWTSGHIPGPRTGHSTVYYNGGMYVLGGKTESTRLFRLDLGKHV